MEKMIEATNKTVSDAVKKSEDARACEDASKKELQEAKKLLKDLEEGTVINVDSDEESEDVGREFRSRMEGSDEEETNEEKSDMESESEKGEGSYNKKRKVAG